jgi:N-acetylglucosamine kinase
MKAIGIDGGGTHTKFVLYDEDKGIIEFKEIGASTNYHSVGIEKTKKVFLDGISSVGKSGFDIIGAGLSSVDTEKDLEVMKNIFKEIGVENIIISNDGMAALWGATEGVGILMVAGTGSIVIGRNHDGVIARAGGWGYIFEEYCGGFWLVKQATMAILDHRDRVGSFTKLEMDLLKYFDLKTAEEIIGLYYPVTDVSKISSGAKIVLDDAQNGDRIATSIVNKGITGAMKLIKSVKLQCRLKDNFTFSYTGGIFSSKYFFEEFKTNFKRRFPQANFINPKFPPEIGAALMAIKAKKMEDIHGKLFE